jgi:DNA-binding NtrC family response regulator
MLVQHIIKKFNERLKKSITGIADDALAALEAHSWPGNIRELENVLERTILFTKGDRIEGADLQLSSAANEPTSQSQPIPMLAPGTVAAIGDDEDGEDATELSGSLKEAVRAETARVERELIVKALDETHGNVTQAARLLKISRKSLQMKMKEFGLRDREA